MNDWYGGSETSPTLNDDLHVLNPSSRVVLLIPNTANRAVNLPDARVFARIGWGTGPNIFVLANVSSSWTVTVKDDAGGTVGVIPVQVGDAWKWAKIHLSDNSTAAGVWHFQLKTP